MPERRGLEAEGGRLGRTHSQGQILETHFDSGPEPPLAQHARSSSYSSTGPGLAERQHASVNLNNSFPGYDTTTPYISSSVTLPATSSDQGFYQNVSGRMRQPSVRQREESRNLAVCIFFPKKWWHFLSGFRRTCVNKAAFQDGQHFASCT